MPFKGFEMKRVSTALALLLGAFTTFSSAAQVNGFVSGFVPGKVDEKKIAKGVETNTSLHSDLMWSLGAEFLAFPVGPLMAGGGVGFISLQKDGSDYVMMPAVPVWGSVGVIAPATLVARPYFEARVGYAIPASRLKTWWNKPLNLFVEGGVGAQLPYHMGVELNCTYLTMDKYFKLSDVEYRLSSLKFGGSITVHFDLFGGAAESNNASAVKQEFVVEPAVQDNSGESSSPEVSENSETPAYEDPYSVYGDTSAEQPAEETVAEETSAEPAEESAPEEAAAEEAPAEESASEEEASAAEEATEDAPAEEAVAEPEAPAEEPAAAPAPEPAPAPKAAAKKAPAKKKAAKKAVKKAPAKKAAKKTTKKPVAKGKKKK